jgi:hypothetical protein
MSINKTLKVPPIYFDVIIIYFITIFSSLCYPELVNVTSVGISNSCTKSYVGNPGSGTFQSEIVSFSDSTPVEFRTLYKNISGIFDPLTQEYVRIDSCIHNYISEFYNKDSSAHYYLYELISPDNYSIIGIEYGRAERIRYSNSNINATANYYSYIISKSESDKYSSNWPSSNLTYHFINDRRILLKEIFYRPTNKFIGISYTSNFIEYKYFFFEGY